MYDNLNSNGSNDNFVITTAAVLQQQQQRLSISPAEFQLSLLCDLAHSIIGKQTNRPMAAAVLHRQQQPVTLQCLSHKRDTNNWKQQY